MSDFSRPGGIAGVIEAHARHTPDRLAVWAGEDRLTYAGLWARVERLAGTLQAMAQPGDRVLLRFPPGADFTIAYLATQLAGLVALPVNPGATPDERSHILADATPALELHPEMHVVTFGPSPRSVSVGPGTWSTILYTSGTTSRPKGVVHSHGSILANLASVREAWGWTPGDHLVIAMPMYHTHGLLVGMLNALLAGSTVSILPAFDALAVLRTIAERRASMFFGVPTMYSRLVNEDAGRHDLSSMRLWVSGSAALPVEVFEQFASRYGHRILERYGMTETGMTLTNPLHGERVPGTVGFPFPRVEVRCVDGEALHSQAPRLVDVAPDAPGELVVRGPNLFVTYLNNPQAHAASFVEGWFMTGDIASRDASGRHRIVGRASTDIIKSRGYRIGALEIEDVIARHPAVLEVAVIGVEHQEWGEAILAVVAPRPGASVDKEELRAFCREHLAGYKCPSSIEVVAEIPKTGPGKFRKRDLIEQYRAVLLEQE